MARTTQAQRTNMTKENILRDFDNSYEEAYYAWNEFYPLAERDLEFYLGNQWSEQEKRQLFEEGRSTFVFNRIRRNINMITGYQRKHRLSSVVAPVEGSDQETADQLSKLLLYALNYGEAYQQISNCFGGALKTGWNLLSIWVDYRDDMVSGDIKFAREPFNGFILDPYFTQMDLSDCNYLLRRKYLSVDHVCSLVPKYEKDIREIHKFGWERDDKFTWLPYQRQPNGEDLMAYNEAWRPNWKKVPVLVDMETGEMTDFEVDDEIIGQFLREYPQLKVVEQPRQYITKQIIINDQPIETEVNPNGLPQYPFVPFFAVFEPESDEWSLKVQSAIRCMIDPQREANRRRSQMTDLLDSQINSGYMATEDSVVNPRSLYQSSQGKVIWKKKNAPPGAIEKIPPAQIPPSMFQLQELFDRDMVEILGVNDAAFGQTEQAGDSGVMMMLRQGAAIINLQDLFDNLRFAQKLASKIVVRLIQQWSPTKVKRILNEEPTEQFYSKDFAKYDVTVQEGILTDTQKQMYFRQLVDLQQLGAPVTGEMLAKAAPIQGKTEYIKELSEMEKQQAQAQQQQMQVQQQLMDSQRQSQQAKAISDIALSKERFTRAVANMGLEDERSSAAVENRADFALKRAKAIKELQSLDDDRLFKYLNLIQMMEQSSKLQEEQIKQDDVQISAQASEPAQNVPQVGNLLEEIPTQQPMEAPNEEAGL